MSHEHHQHEAPSAQASMPICMRIVGYEICEQAYQIVQRLPGTGRDQLTAGLCRASICRVNSQTCSATTMPVTQA